VVRPRSWWVIYYFDTPTFGRRHQSFGRVKYSGMIWQDCTRPVGLRSSMADHVKGSVCERKGSLFWFWLDKARVKGGGGSHFRALKRQHHFCFLRYFLSRLGLASLCIGLVLCWVSCRAILSFIISQTSELTKVWVACFGRMINVKLYKIQIVNMYLYWVVLI